MLCTFCSNIDLDQVSTPEGYKHHPSCFHLYQSAQNGCASCKLIWDSQWVQAGGILSSQDHDPGPLETQIIVRAFVLNTRDIKRLRYGQEVRNSQVQSRLVYAAWNRGETGGAPYLWTFLSIVAKPEDRSAEYLSQRPFLDAAHTEDLWRPFVKRWLRDCLDNHEACSPETTSTVRPPTRVIDLGVSDGDQDLVLHTSGNEVRDWVTLSHCWGQKVPLQTTKHTLASHQTCLPLHALPNLFRDAVAITRDLGYRYLWIDSLCIIQDSEEDRAHEIAHMGEIYKNSILTIAASNCRDSNDRILGTPSPARTRDYTEQGCVSSKSQFKSTMYAFYFQKWRDSHKEASEADSARGGLNSRAWALQEQVLSPRTIHWTPLQVTWSCRCMNLSEQCPSGANNVTEDEALNFPEPPTHRHHSPKKICLSQDQLETARQQLRITAPGLEDSSDPLQIWYLMVQQFMSRSITYETDSFPAISGLAREVRRHTGHDYLAGLWAQDIHNGLLWSIAGPAEYPDVYVGPSWSWASVKKTINAVNAAGFGPDRPSYIYYGINTTLKPVAEILGADIVYTSADRLGPVKSAKLRLRAPWKYISDFREMDLILPFIEDDVKRGRYFGDEPSGVEVDDGTIKCWLDGRGDLEYSREALKTAVGNVKASGAVVVRIAGLDWSGNLDLDFEKPRENECKRVLNNQNWCLVLLASADVEAGDDGVEKVWKRIGIARAADDLVTVDWESGEFVII